MPKLLILVGISGSGKSTYARALIASEPKWIRVNRDDIRRQICGELTQAYYARTDLKELEKQITVVQNQQIKHWLQQDYNVVVDNTNLQKKYVLEMFEFNHLADVQIMVIETAPEDCKERVVGRDGNINVAYINSQAKDFEAIKPWAKGMGISPRKIIKHGIDNTLPFCILVDLDGTCADHHGIRSPFDWDKVDLDRPIDEVRGLLNALDYGVDIIYFSGRDGSCRAKSIQWLNTHEFPKGELIMRKEGDQRKDSIIKRELLYDNIIGKYNIGFVIDDRLQVLDMWNSEGIFTINVNQGLKYF